MHSKIWLQITHEFPSNFFLKHVTLVEEMKYGLDIWFFFVLKNLWSVFHNFLSTVVYSLEPLRRLLFHFVSILRFFLSEFMLLGIGHEGKVEKNGFRLNYLLITYSFTNSKLFPYYIEIFEDFTTLWFHLA